MADAKSISDGYNFTGAALELGTVVLDGTCDPSAKIRVPLAMMNRHGLIAGATGTGKTKTLQLLTEQLSAAGVPVVVADMKGDLSGLAQAGAASDRVTQRAKDTGDDWTGTAFPVEFVALGGLGTGVPIRATMTSFGPTLLAKVLDLNDTQESSLNLVFHYADKNGLALLDLKDLRAVISFLTSDEGKADLAALGGLSKATAGVILRDLIQLEDGGGDVFFGEPEFETTDLIRTTSDGRGVVTSVELPGVADKPQLFSTFLMWLLADLFHELPEVGDPDKPKLVFFFDEAHLLFNGASKAFLQAVTQTVRLIRSKGVGIFFVTQNPTDVPDEVLGQLGNRVQHALRAFTPDDATALAKTVRTYPKTANYDLAEVLQKTRHRRGDRHRAGRFRSADTGRLDPAARAPLADGADRSGRAAGHRDRVPARDEVRHRDRPRLGLREAAGEASAARAFGAGRAVRSARFGGAGTPQRRSGPRHGGGWRRRGARRHPRVIGVQVVRPISRHVGGPRDHPRHLRNPQTVTSSGVPSGSASHA